MDRKTVAINQSNYLPWKGYFDLIASVDEFILYDDMQFTKNDWRNRNQIKTAKGIEWLSVPVGQDIRRRIRDVLLPADRRWQTKHWKTIETNYGRAPHFAEVASFLAPIYAEPPPIHLSVLNRRLIEAICRYLGIVTRITNSWDYRLEGGQTGRLVSLCQQAGATRYLSGPAAKDYLDEGLFRTGGIEVIWMDYNGYPEYPQLWGPFVHQVSIIDLLCNCGQEAPRYMKFASR